MKTHTLIQDGRNKLKVTMSENEILVKAKQFFKWRKEITMKRINGLGSFDYNNFIEYLIK